jgi:hypothetical protein
MPDENDEMDATVPEPETPAAQPEPLKPYEALAAEAGLAVWEKAALARSAGWAPGKSLTPAEFDAALNAFRSRRQGGGKIHG